MENNATYYLILDSIVGKLEEGSYYLFNDQKWCLDTRNVIMDRLMGYDPSEPPGSPYGMGNGSVMDTIEEISYEKVMELTGGTA